MMYYYFQVATLENTPETSPVISHLKLGKGIWDFVDVGIPARVSRLCKCRLFYNTIQVLPFNRDEWLTGDNVTLRVPMKLEIKDEPYLITIHTFNLDDTFFHQLSFGFSLDVGQIAGLQGLQGLPMPVQIQSEG